MSRAAILWHYWQAKHRFTHWKSRANLTAWQERRVIRHLQWVARRSPFFHEYAGSCGFEKWRELPILTKTEMMANFDTWNTAGIRQSEAQAVAEKAETTRQFKPNVNGITVGLSTGTSGSRGLFLASESEQHAWSGVMLQRVLRGTLLQQHRLALFLRADSNLYQQAGSQRIKFRFFDLQRPPGELWASLREYGPTVLAAPPRVLRELSQQPWAAAFMQSPGIILSVADVLETEEAVPLRHAFGRRVDQIYQATEGFLAASCPHGHLHWNEDCLILEKAWLDGNRTRYHPVITDFRRRTQPIIRYRLNDIIVEPDKAGNCACGSIFTRIGRIEGRSDEVLQLPSRALTGCVPIYPDFVRRALALSLPVGVEYRVRQKSRSHWEIALSDLSNSSRVEAAVVRLANDFDAEVPELEFVEYQATGLQQKRRRIVCEL
jgi:putative adenylate-forming enzyme